MDPDEARRRILEELAKGKYRREGSFVQWLLGTLQDWLGHLVDGASGDPVIGTTVAVVVVLLVLAIAVLVLRRTGRLRRSTPYAGDARLDADPQLSADELRVRARRALESGRQDDAVVLAVRSLVRDLHDRTLLDLTAGMTAHEAALGAAEPFPDLRGRLLRTADAFDTAAYSRRPVTQRQAEAAVLLAEFLAQSTPQHGRTPEDAEAAR
ncbi:DUF4129 domain-containing protein [Brachybacterium sp. AOP25-B2-12]|uniref:DUF4129 domain-containing protein n=1 Tax=Brachybacterium sp. AOP25-B2-12 TaxID=3457710 RepID=UPI004034940B